jgi:hypothetical protein
MRRCQSLLQILLLLLLQILLLRLQGEGVVAVPSAPLMKSLLHQNQNQSAAFHKHPILVEQDMFLVQEKKLLQRSRDEDT